MWDVTIERKYKLNNCDDIYTDKVRFKAKSLAEVGEIISVFENYGVGDYVYSAKRDGRSKGGEEWR